MESNHIPNTNVLTACVRLLEELDIHKNIDVQYCIPYSNYVMSWAWNVPIHTIIIGQNPYPQNIYPEIGSALSYDTSRQKEPTVSVRNIAYDIHNYDGTPVEDTIECFSNSWRLLECGILCINETVMDIFLKPKRNTRAVKEMEMQFRVLQVLIAESFFAGCELFTCVAMGIKAEQMSSIIRSWFPKDLFRIRVMSCKNPAARDIGDLPSHKVTIGKPGVSKVLSSVVRKFKTMPPQYGGAAEKRRKQNEDALRKSMDDLKVTGDMYANELGSFHDRLKSVTTNDIPGATMTELAAAIGSLKNVIEKHRNAAATHTVAMLLLAESISKDTKKQDNSQSSQSPSLKVPVTASPSPSRGPRKRNKTPTANTTTMSPLVEEPEVTAIPAVKESIENNAPSVSAPTVHSVTPSRARKRSKTPKYAQSDVPTEYTADMSVADNSTEEISIPESVNIRCFADWCNSELKDDTTYFEILSTAAEERKIMNDLVRSVLDYIRSRKGADSTYDAYDELQDANSESFQWASSHIGQ